MSIVVYRVTGEKSTGRLRDLLAARPKWRRAESGEKCVLDFVWETASNGLREEHKKARVLLLWPTRPQVLNRISGLDPLQNKSSLAFLQRSTKLGVLKTYVLKGPNDPRLSELLKEDGVWIAKHNLAQNGQAKVLFRPSESAELFLARLRDLPQKYVERPHLWDGLKYDLRVYVLLKADFSLYIYQKILPRRCVVEFSLSDLNDYCHISNYSVAMKIPGFIEKFKQLGEMQVITRGNWEFYDVVWKQICAITSELVGTVSEFGRYQLDANHFEMMGWDFVVDDCMKVWFIEANRSPGLENIGPIVENGLFVPLMRDVLSLCVDPVVEGKPVDPGDWQHVPVSLPMEPREYCSSIEKNILYFSHYLYKCKLQDRREKSERASA